MVGDRFSRGRHGETKTVTTRYRARKLRWVGAFRPMGGRPPGGGPPAGSPAPGGDTKRYRTRYTLWGLSLSAGPRARPAGPGATGPGAVALVGPPRGEGPSAARTTARPPVPGGGEGGETKRVTGLMGCGFPAPAQDGPGPGADAVVADRVAHRVGGVALDEPEGEELPEGPLDGPPAPADLGGQGRLAGEDAPLDGSRLRPPKIPLNQTEEHGPRPRREGKGENRLPDCPFPRGKA